MRVCKSVSSHVNVGRRESDVGIFVGAGLATRGKVPRVWAYYVTANYCQFKHLERPQHRLQNISERTENNIGVLIEKSRKGKVLHNTNIVCIRYMCSLLANVIIVAKQFTMKLHAHRMNNKS